MSFVSLYLCIAKYKNFVLYDTSIFLLKHTQFVILFILDFPKADFTHSLTLLTYSLAQPTFNPVYSLFLGVNNVSLSLLLTFLLWPFHSILFVLTKLDAIKKNFVFAFFFSMILFVPLSPAISLKIKIKKTL